MELTFEKWEDGRWFVVLPDYDGPQEDLEMVDGADEFMQKCFLINIIHWWKMIKSLRY